MLNLLLKELKLIAKNRRINGYKIMSKDKLLSMINTSKPTKNNRKADIKNLFKPKMHYDNNSDSIHYKGLRDIRALFKPKEDYHKPIRIGNAFSRNYI